MDSSCFAFGVSWPRSTRARRSRRLRPRSEQLAYAYATLVEDCERVVDEVGYAEVRVRCLHG
jgi:hypothetical protein